jgi:hypothetical protein
MAKKKEVIINTNGIKDSIEYYKKLGDNETAERLKRLLIKK